MLVVDSDNILSWQNELLNQKSMIFSFISVAISLEVMVSCFGCDFCIWLRCLELWQGRFIDAGPDFFVVFSVFQKSWILRTNSSFLQTNSYVLRFLFSRKKNPWWNLLNLCLKSSERCILVWQKNSMQFCFVFRRQHCETGLDKSIHVWT